MRKKYNQFLVALDPILGRHGFSRDGNFWKKECHETYVGFRLGYLSDSNSMTGFFGSHLKEISDVEFSDFDINLWDSHIHGTIGAQMTGLTHIQYSCSTQLNNKTYRFLRDWYGDDPEFNAVKLEYLKNPPYQFARKLKLFLDIFERETMPLLYALGTEDGMRRLIYDEGFAFSVWTDLAIHLGVITEAKAKQKSVGLGDYNYKTFVQFK